MPVTTGHRRELAYALVAAWCLVLARCAVYVLYEQSFFDSDQATFGLMAKHLVEGRAFPLFMYGQNYMLAVDAWLAAPVIFLFGPTVAALHGSLVLTNLAVVTLLLIGLHRYCGLRPFAGLAAVMFFAFAPPLTTATLVEPAANISPFLFVVLLWFVRDRPLWFGAILGVGFLTREFTAYAVPVLIGLQLVRGALFREARLRQWLLAAVAVVAVWEGVQALRPYADPMGPGTRGVHIQVFNESQIGNVTDRIRLAPAEWSARALAMARRHLPRLVGARHVEDGISPQGHDWLFWPLAAALATAIARALWFSRASLARGTGLTTTAPRWEFAAYLFGVGFTAAAAYVATRPAGDAPDRYFLLALLLPVGAIAWFLTVEPNGWLRRAMVAVVLVWAMASGADHLAQVKRYWGGRVPNDLRMLADTLVARDIRVATATYWRAYKLTYLTGERVKIASNDFVRIDEYQRLAAAAGDALITIQEEPCAHGERVSQWYLCRQ